MRRALIALAAAASVAGFAASVSLGSTKVAVNPELVNPVVVSGAFLTAPWTGGVISPSVDPTGVVQASSFSVPSGFWDSANGYLPVVTTPPSDPPEIVIANVQQRMSILYVTDASAKAILGTSSDMREMPWLFRQEPSNSGGDAALAGGGTQRMWKVSGAALAAKPSAEAMANMLKAAIERRCETPAGINTCGAKLVGVDEIGAAFGSEPGASDAGTAGARLNAAMISLAKKEFRPGISYASRVHFYVAPGVITSISAGLGPKRTLGANGKEMRRDYSQVMSAISRSGGAWLEMYHYPGRGKPRTPFTGAEWRDVPTRFAAFLKERTTGNRDPLNYLHFVLTDTPGADAPAAEPCAVTPAGGASPNAIDPGDVDPGDVEQTLQGLPACPASPPPPCPVLMPPSSNSMSAGQRREMLISPSWLDTRAERALLEVQVSGSVRLAVLSPNDSGMTCQWQRAQGGAVNTRILANGPAAFKVTGTEAEIFGQQFRQFFVVP